MKNWSIWHWLVFIALVGMTSFFGAGLIKAIADGGIGSSAVAAWTQAIGAVIAIVVAVWVMRYQTNRAREERIEKQRFEDQRKVKSLLAFYEEIIFSVSPF